MRRFLLPIRFSLRTLLVLTAIACCAASWVGGAKRQREAVALLYASNPGATVRYAGAFGSGGSAISSPGCLPLDYRATVSELELAYPTDADLQCATRMPHLRKLTLVRAIDLTDAGLAALAKLTRLHVLEIDEGDRLTDAGLMQLARVKSLRELQLACGRSRFSAEAIEELRRALPECRVSVRGLEPARDEIAAVR